MEVLVNGVPLPEYHQRGTTYVEAVRNAECSVRLTNHTPGRIAVALYVDGLNSIDTSATPAERATEWVVDAYQSITVDGWQISSEVARRFYFTTAEDSSAARLGCTANLGEIEAVVFRESAATDHS
jgi:hypothetical protein